MATLLPDMVFRGYEFESIKVSEGFTTDPLGERDTDLGAHFLLLILSLAKEGIG